MSSKTFSHLLKTSIEKKKSVNAILRSQDIFANSNCIFKFCILLDVPQPTKDTGLGNPPISTAFQTSLITWQFDSW